MKPFFRNILKIYLRLLTHLVLFVHRPRIIAIAGSTNKHFVKQEVKRQLESSGLKVRANQKNFNTEIGLPLAVLNLPSGYNSYARWRPLLLEAFKKIFQKDFPEYLVLSLGSSDPGDIKYLLKIIKPQIVVITDITQRYSEGFSDLEELLGEYKQLASKLNEEGFLILNFDNERIRSLAALTSARTIGLGFSSDSDYVLEKIKRDKFGQDFLLKKGGESIDLRVERHGEHHMYAKSFAYITHKIIIKKDV